MMVGQFVSAVTRAAVQKRMTTQRTLVPQYLHMEASTLAEMAASNTLVEEVPGMMDVEMTGMLAAAVAVVTDMAGGR
jgi:hypothetical protein